MNNLPPIKAMNYFWNATGLSRVKMTKVIWKYFRNYKYEMVLPLLPKKSKVSLEEYVAQNQMEDLHTAVYKGKGELLSLLDEPLAVTNRLTIMHAIKYPKDLIMAAAEGYAPETVELFLKYWCNLEDFSVADFPEFLTYLDSPMMARAWYESIVNKDIDKVSKIIMVPASLDKMEEFSFELENLLLKKALVASDNGNQKLTRKYLENFRILKTLSTGFRPHEETLVDLLSKDLDPEDQPKIYTLLELQALKPEKTS